MSADNDGFRFREPERLQLPIALCILPVFHVAMIVFGVAQQGQSLVVFMWYLGIAASTIAALLSAGAVFVSIAQGRCNEDLQIPGVPHTLCENEVVAVVSPAGTAGNSPAPDNIFASVL